MEGRKEGCEDPWQFFEANRGARAEGLWNTGLADEVTLGPSNATKIFTILTHSPNP